MNEGQQQPRCVCGHAYDMHVSPESRLIDPGMCVNRDCPCDRYLSIPPPPPGIGWAVLVLERDQFAELNLPAQIRIHEVRCRPQSADPFYSVPFCSSVRLILEVKVSHEFLPRCPADSPIMCYSPGALRRHFAELAKHYDLPDPFEVPARNWMAESIQQTINRSTEVPGE